MKFQTLSSGSKGNCAYFQSNQAKILVDCGMTLKTVDAALKSIGVNPEEIDAIFVTHEHSDHICGVDNFVKKYHTKVFVHRDGFAETAKKLYWANSHITHFDGAPFYFADILVEHYPCAHDSVHCSGYKFSVGNRSVACVTDLGRVDNSFFEFVKNVDLLLLESNHDEEMLRLGSYPYILKKRISGERGHLSNSQADEIVVKLPQLNVKNVWLGHLSLVNNTPEIAFHSALEALKKANLCEGRDICVTVVTQFEKSEVFEIE